VHKPQRQVQTFHREVLDGPTSPAEPKIRNGELRARLIAEEAAETVYALVGRDDAIRILLEYAYPHPHHTSPGKDASNEPNLEEAIDGIADTIVVCYGAAEAIGIDLEPFYDEVMRANMAKAGGPTRADGKRLKPPGWTPPDIKGVLESVRSDHVLVVAVRSAIGAGEPDTREQRISFAYGNVSLHNPKVTREMVARIVDEMDGAK
jgi:predicted HAD superfamily Cof-like phosphohydrolase